MTLRSQQIEQSKLDQLRQALQEKQQEIAMLQEIGQAINSAYKLQDILQMVADKARVLVSASTTLIPIINQNCTDYTYMAGSGENIDEIIGESLPIDFGVCGWVWRNKRAWWRGIISELDEQEQIRWEKEAGTVILVPLIGNKHFLGGISALNKSSGEDFNQRDLFLLSLFADQVSIAIEKTRLFEQAKKAQYQAEQANHAKSMFLAMISHELRTPLNAIIGYSEMIVEELEAKQQITFDSVEPINHSAKHLLKLIDELLEYTQFGTLNRQLDKQTIRLKVLAINLVDQFRKMAEANHNQIELLYVPDDETMQGDLTKIHHIFYHLFSNACKFTKNGKIQLQIQKIWQGEQAWIHFVLDDTGRGIPAEFNRQVFDPFFQVEHLNDSSSTCNTGLGLSIVKEYCEFMGGDVHLSSDLGQGSRVEVKLPAK